MSSIRSIDLLFVDELVDFVRGAGYVLDFSDPSFTLFFATELDVDIDDPTYAEGGKSKGKRLRSFLHKVDNPTAVKALNALWDHRVAILARRDREDPVKNAEGRFLALVRRLGGEGGAETGPQETPKTAFDLTRITALGNELVQLSDLDPQARGYAFESFLKSLFDCFGLKARDSFRNRGEQIDGSFVLAQETYLLEAKWQSALTGAADLHGFQGKLEEKAAWARGLFISHSGFTPDGLHAIGRGKKVVCMDGLDLHDALRRQLPLDHVLDRKVRRAAETGHPFIRVRDLFPD
jgi:hypothetical protein